MNQQLKQRLVGAVVLVSLAVIFIPIILEGPDDEWSPRTQGMPEPPQISYHAEGETGLPLPVEEPPEVISTAPGSRTAEPPPPVGADPSTTTQPPVVEQPAVPAPAPQPVKATPPAPAATRGWAIQVGRFSQRLNAQGMRDRLKKAGYAAYLQEAQTDGKQSWKVLVGPLKTRRDAEKVRDELASKRQLKGFVIQNKG